MTDWIDVKMFLNVFTFLFFLPLRKKQTKQNKNKNLAMNRIHPEYFSVNSMIYTIVEKFISSSNVA